MKQTIPKKARIRSGRSGDDPVLLPAAASAADSEYSASGATGFAFTDSGIAAEDGSFTGYKISGTSLTIRGLTLNITAPVNDAINAEQTLNIESGTLNISAGDDAIHCDYVMNVGASRYNGAEHHHQGVLRGSRSGHAAHSLRQYQHPLRGRLSERRKLRPHGLQLLHQGRLRQQQRQLCPSAGAELRRFTDVAASDWFYSAVPLRMKTA